MLAEGFPSAMGEGHDMNNKTAEVTYYDVLKRIASYLPPSQLRRTAGQQYGLDYEEALEMAYENVLIEAKSALRGKRRPSESPKSTGPAKAEQWERDTT